MTDAEVLELLADKLGSNAIAAKAIGVSAQGYSEWKATGISAEKRVVVWMLANIQGAGLPESWLLRGGGKRRKKDA